MTTSPFVTAGWLAGQLGLAGREAAAPPPAVVDGSWYLPAMARDPEAEFLAGHIPGAVRFDIEAIRDKASPLPHMMPSPEDFAAGAGALGLTADRPVVVYDGAGLFSAPRVWWMLRVMGARQVFILQGGLPTWKAEGWPLESGPAHRPQPTTFVTSLRLAPSSTIAAWRRPSPAVIARSLTPVRQSALPAWRQNHAPASPPVTCQARAIRRRRVWSPTAC